jgi:ATP-dependent exoDNAse (exonuclease V) alpha subunit
VSAFTELIKPVLICPGLSKSQQIDFIEKIDSPDLPPNDILILEGDPFILLCNIDTRSGLPKGRHCRALQMKNQTVVIQFDNGEIRALTRISMEKTSDGMKFVRWQLPLRPLFAGTVHPSQGMTLQRAVIDCRNKFWEHGQLYVALSRVRSPADLCILLPSDSDDFAIRPSLDRDVVQILETINASRRSTITPIVPGDDVQAEPAFIKPYEALSI